MAGELPAETGFDAYIQSLIANPPKVATRKSSEMALEALTAAIPEMVGGSADLTGSNNPKTKSTPPFNADHYDGRYVYYGIREFGMATAMVSRWGRSQGLRRTGPAEKAMSLFPAAVMVAEASCPAPSKRMTGSPVRSRREASAWRASSGGTSMRPRASAGQYSRM